MTRFPTEIKATESTSVKPAKRTEQGCQIQDRFVKTSNTLAHQKKKKKNSLVVEEQGSTLLRTTIAE